MNSRITHSFRIYNSTMKNLFKIYDFWYLAIASAIASFGEWGASLGIIVVISRHFATHQLPVTALPGPGRSQAGRGAGGPGAGQARRPRPPSRSPEPGHRAVTDGFCLSPCGSAGRGRVLRVPGRRHATCMIIRVSATGSAPAGRTGNLRSCFRAGSGAARAGRGPGHRGVPPGPWDFNLVT